VLIGYAYVGGEDREGLQLQLETLSAAGCERRFADAGSWRERPELERALLELRDGRDCLVVCRLDRLGRSLRDLIATVSELEQRRIGFRSLEDGIDTIGAAGVFVALAQFDGVLARERTRALVWAEGARERRGGRLPGPRSPTRTSGMEFAPDLIEPIIGFRHWRLVNGTLRSMFGTTPWVASEMTARCPAGDHDPAETPSPECPCGIYASYAPCPRTASAMTHDLIGGAIVMWGRIEAHATGMRAEHARIVALDLPVSRAQKRRAVLELAERLGVPAVAHGQLRAKALAHGTTNAARTAATATTADVRRPSELVSRPRPLMTLACHRVADVPARSDDRGVAPVIVIPHWYYLDTIARHNR
jgi:DNA invertase Pin-like site-specific DNA recombinase